MKTFLFYDVETSGLNPAFDQVLTFASIRTDLKLNELDRKSITIQLRDDVVPSPGAFLTHGLSFEELAEGKSEYEAAKIIHELVNTPGTISLGYNSLGFDDEFLRFLFYRNLLDPYSHQYSNGCSRMDILPVTAIFRVFAPDCLKWPEKDGKSSLKLDLITQANGFETSGRAHEAMSDVEALIALCRIFFRQSDVWNYCLEFFHKQREDVRINSIDRSFEINGKHFTVAIMVSASLGAQANYLAPVLCIGNSRVYKNQTLWIRLDTEDMLGMAAELPVEETFVIRKRSADALIILPPLERFWNRLPDAAHAKTDENLDHIRNNPDRFFSFIEYHRDFKYPYVPDMDVDASLYQDGFFTGKEKKEMQVFHAAIKGGDTTVINRMESPRIKTLAARIIARNFNSLGADDQQNENAQMIKKLVPVREPSPIIGYRNDSKLSCQKALEELLELERQIEKQDTIQQQILPRLKKYIRSL